MKKILQYMLLLVPLTFLGTFVVPEYVFALQQGELCDPGQSGELCDVPSSGGQSITLKNPLANSDGTGVTSIPKLVEAILNIVLTIAVPIIALAIIYSGYKFVAAQGNPTKLKEAKETLVYVLIGAAILLAAYAIANAVVSTIEAIRG